MTKKFSVEICIAGTDSDSVRQAAAARRGGADAVELCRAMHLDGLTPPPSHTEAARGGFGPGPGLRVMVRLRDGSFSCTDAEVRAMAGQIHAAAEAGADGVVLGVLRESDGRISETALRHLLRGANSCGLGVTFHRAFDAAPDADEALESLITLGVARVLTSGRPWGSVGGALDGLPRLQRTIERAAGRIEVIVGGGITADILPGLLAALPRDAGTVSVHAYSGAQTGGVTTAEAVRGLVTAASQFA